MNIYVTGGIFPLTERFCLVHPSNDESKPYVFTVKSMFYMMKHAGHLYRVLPDGNFELEEEGDSSKVESPLFYRMPEGEMKQYLINSVELLKPDGVKQSKS